MRTTQQIKVLPIPGRRRPRPPVRQLLGVLFLSSVVWSVGCGHGDRPPLGDVQGTVTLDGQPLARAKVTFRPVAGGRTSYAFTDENGHYRLNFLRDIKGAIPGSHKVQIYKAATDSEESRENLVPARYNKESNLVCEVSKGQNTFDFDLKGK